MVEEVLDHNLCIQREVTLRYASSVAAEGLV